MSRFEDSAGDSLLVLDVCVWNPERQCNSYHWAVIRGSVLHKMTLQETRENAYLFINHMSLWMILYARLRQAARPEGWLTGFVSTQFRLLLNWLCLTKSNRLGTVSARAGAFDLHTSPVLNGVSAYSYAFRDCSRSERVGSLSISYGKIQ